MHGATINDTCFTASVGRVCFNSESAAAYNSLFIKATAGAANLKP
jgi:NRPS condensation-like uncharacterized protein